MSDYFDFHVISLPEREDRRRECRRQFERAGLDWSDISVFSAFRPSEAAGFPTIGAHGCYLSHLELLRSRIGNPRPLMVCEDDLNLSPQYAERVEDVVALLETQPWGIFYGGWHPCGQETLHMQPRRSDSWITHAHMVAFHPDVIPRLVTYLDDLIKREPMHVDIAFCHFRASNPDVVTRAAVPPLGYQRASRSSIQVLKWHDNVPLVKHLAPTMRGVKNWWRTERLS